MTEREGEREGERGRERGREGERGGEWDHIGVGFELCGSGFRV